MTDAVADSLLRFAECPKPSEASTIPFKLDSLLEPAASADDIEKAWPAGIPPSVDALWRTARAGRLFVDDEYGQWGLELLSPAESAARTALERETRARDFHSDDMVLGAFLGDQELAVVAGDGCVLIALPLDERGDWYTAAEGLGEFLSRYWRHGGEKFWERSKS